MYTTSVPNLLLWNQALLPARLDLSTFLLSVAKLLAYDRYPVHTMLQADMKNTCFCSGINQKFALAAGIQNFQPDQ